METKKKAFVLDEQSTPKYPGKHSQALFTHIPWFVQSLKQVASSNKVLK